MRAQGSVRSQAQQISFSGDFRYARGDGAVVGADDITDEHAAVHIQADGGRTYSLALKNDGSVYKWGRTESGELGNGVGWNNNLHSPQLIGPSTVIQVAAGNGHALALLRDGSTRAWGSNFHGQLGDSTRNERLVPSVTRSPSCIVALAAGHSHTLALDSDGNVWASGYNKLGALGNGNYSIINTFPTKVQGLTDVVAIRIPGLVNPRSIEAGDGNWAMALVQDGTLRSWGYNADRVLATGAPFGVYRYSHEPVPGVVGVSRIGAGFSTAHVFGMLSSTVAGVCCVRLERGGEVLSRRIILVR